VLVAGMLLVSGCQGKEPGQVVVSPLPANTVATSPLPPAQESPVITPVSQPGMGTVIGRLAVERIREPFAGGELYLAKLTGNGEHPLYSLDIHSDPRAYIDRQGNFVFVDIPPGNYGLVFWSPAGSLLVANSSGTSVTFTVTANEVVDLGTIVVTP